MNNVTKEPVGTARNRFRSFRIPIYGKTGTAETAQADPHAWFVGYAPYDAPRYAISVFVKNAGHGGEMAAPLAAQILDVVFNPKEVKK